MDDKTIKAIEKELKLHAKAIGIPEGAAESFIDTSLKSVRKSIKTKTTVTPSDITRLVAKELKKYHQDLAYVYQNYDKII